MIKKLVKPKISADRAVLTSLFVDFLDIIANAIVAIITGSVVMLAETIQGVADTASVGFVYLGLKRSRRPANENFQFGHGKALYIWTFVAGIIMFGVTSVLVFYFGLKRLLNPEEISHIYIAIIVLILFVFSNGYSLSVGYRRIMQGKKKYNFIKIFKQSMLVETKTTFVLDLIGTTAALIGLFALLAYKITGNLAFDGLGAMAIGFTLAFLTLFLLNNTRQLLIGKRASRELEKKIIKSINSFKNVNAVLDLKTMNIGLNKILVNAEVNVNPNLKTLQIEKLMDNIKEKVQKANPEVVHIQIELETPNDDEKKRLKKD